MEKVRFIEWPKDKSRVETGTVQFGDDWPGIFVRGDNALWFAYNLRRVLTTMKEQIEKDPMLIIEAGTINNLITLFESCQVTKMSKDE